MSNDAEVERMIQERDLTAPRVTPALVEAQIRSCRFERLSGTLMVCVLTLRNGFVVTGESACASPENFDQEIGERIARGNATAKIWGHEGYLLRSILAGHVVRLGDPETPSEDPAPATSGLDFGEALRALKAGKRVAREGWNGKGMWLSMSGPLEGRVTPTDRFWSANNRAYAEANGGGAVVLPSITMKTADGAILMGWLASQTDMFADDWCIV